MASTRVYIGRLANSARESDVERFFRSFGKLREITLKEGYGFVEFSDKQDADDAVYELNGKELCGDRVIVEHAKPPGERRERGGGRGGGFRGGYGDRGGSDGYGRSGGYGGGRGGGGYSSAGYRSSSSGYDRPRNPPPQRSEHRLLVENLSSRVSWQDLKDYMRKAGEVVYADAHRLRPNEGVVEFASASDLKNAMAELNDTELNGRRIKLVEDAPRTSSGSRSRRSRSRSDSRERSRSPRRSRSSSRSD